MINNIEKIHAFIIAESYLKEMLKLHFDISPEDYELTEVFNEDYFSQYITLSLSDVIYISNRDNSSEFYDEQDNIETLICTIIKDIVPSYTKIIIIETRK